MIAVTNTKPCFSGADPADVPQALGDAKPRDSRVPSAIIIPMRVHTRASSPALPRLRARTHARPHASTRAPTRAHVHPPRGGRPQRGRCTELVHVEAPQSTATLRDRRFVRSPPCQTLKGERKIERQEEGGKRRRGREGHTPAGVFILRRASSS